MTYPSVVLAWVLSDDSAWVSCGSVTEAERHHDIGVELRERGRFEDAIAEYNEAIRLDPSLAITYSNRGDAFADLGQLERAIGGLRRRDPS